MALFVKVRHNTLPGMTPGPSTRPSAASARYTTRAAITEVLPEPAPAISTQGSNGQAIAAHCSSVGSAPIAATTSAGATLVLIGAPPDRTPAALRGTAGTGT